MFKNKNDIKYCTLKCFGLQFAKSFRDDYKEIKNKIVLISILRSLNIYNYITDINIEVSKEILMKTI